MSGNIGLIVLNLILFAMLVLAWQLWRQSVPKRRKVKAAEVADWPSAPAAHPVDSAPAVATAPVQQLVTAGAPMPVAATPETAAPEHVAPGHVAPGHVAPGHVASEQVFAAPSAPVEAHGVVDHGVVDHGVVDHGVAHDTSGFASPAAPSPSFAAPSSTTIDDDELTALLAAAPPTSVAPVNVHPQPAAQAATPTSLFTTQPVEPAPAAPMAAAPVSSLAPPMGATTAHSAGSVSLGDDVSRQVQTLLATPPPPAQAPVSTLPAPTLPAPTLPAPTLSATLPAQPQPGSTGIASPSLPPLPASTGTTDRLRLDITGRPVDDVMRSLSTRLGDMSYSAQTGPSGETVFQRGASESIRIAVSAQDATSTDAEGRPLPGRADIEVVGGQLQETTEAVLFELLDHGFQLRWAVAGELVLSSFDGALARVNVNPTPSS